MTARPTALYRNIGFTEASPYLQIPAGHYDIELRVAGSNRAIFKLKDFNADGGHIQTLAAAGGIGRPVELVQMYDSTSVAVTPQGGAATGAGGMVARQLAPQSLVLGVPIAAAGALLLLAWHRRRTTVS